MGNTISAAILSTIIAFPLANNGVWKSQKSFPGESRQAAISFTISNKAYLFGGCKGTVDFKDLWMYDPVTNAWTKRKSCPDGGIREPIAFVVNNIAYIGLGVSKNQQISKFYKYNPDKDEWTKLPDFYQNRRAAKACSIDSMGFVFGGFAFGEKATNDFFAYNAITQEWEGRESLPSSAPPRSYPVLEAFNGKIYLMGGLSIDREFLSDFWEYDPELDEWNELPEFIGEGRTTASSFVLDSLIYVGLGKNETDHLQDWYAYSPKLKYWSTVKNFPETTTYGNTSFSILKKGYVCTGAYNGKVFSNRLYSYTPEKNK